ncbi:uncharacterized protein LOC131649539 [Vicia villosa]|uniref:uncharacterized protein LOC131649539 n=1 Tax=Vicia villosa TaxID=3911 RepID=UPI00273BE200|nr:uncharacterized protein LOC131649539 [Vicia villosa]
MSGYKLWRKEQGWAGFCRVDGNWCSLWNIGAPPRVKHLLWKICRGCLQPRVRLRQHRVSCPASCPFCDNPLEDIWHVLFGREDSMTAGRVAVMIEVIWKNRNNLIWNNESDNFSRLGLHALSSWHEWHLAQESVIRVNNQHASTSLSPPGVGMVKCNVDAGFNISRGTSNWGWCVRNHLGSFVVAGTSWDFGLFPILEMEALALKEAILNVIDLLFDHVIFESDCQRVTQAIQSNHNGISEFSYIISSIKSLLTSFPNFEVKFVKRQANSVAHTLAKVADSWTRRSLFYTNPPYIESLLINNMS